MDNNCLHIFKIKKMIKSLLARNVFVPAFLAAGAPAKNTPPVPPMAQHQLVTATKLPVPSSPAQSSEPRWGLHGQHQDLPPHGTGLLSVALAVPVWERRCLLRAVWLGKVRLHSLQM